MERTPCTVGRAAQTRHTRALAGLLAGLLASGCAPDRAHEQDDAQLRGRLTITGSSTVAPLWEEIKDRLDAPALSLSGGQQQRLCLARALVLDPEVILLDEPCSALDPLAGAVVEDLIGSLRHQLTVIIVTHNLAQAKRIADDVAVFWMRDGAGTVIEAGPADAVFGAPRSATAAAYIGGARG